METANSNQTIKPDAFWYGIAALLFIALSCAGIAKIYFTIKPLLSNSTETRFLGPGEKEITLTVPDRYVLWCYESAFFQGRTYVQKSGLPEGLDLKIIDKSSGRQIRLENDTGSTLTLQNERCFSLASFQTEKLEKLTVSINGITESRVFSIRRSLCSLIRGTLGPIFYGIILMGIGFMSGTGITIAVYIKREKALREQKK